MRAFGLRINQWESCDEVRIHCKTLEEKNVRVGSGVLLESRVALRPAPEAAFRLSW